MNALKPQNYVKLRAKTPKLRNAEQMKIDALTIINFLINKTPFFEGRLFFMSDFVPYLLNRR